MTDFGERVPGADYVQQVYLDATPDGLNVTADDADTQVTVLLNDFQVRQLRLALTRYERSLEKKRSTGEAKK